MAGEGSDEDNVVDKLGDALDKLSEKRSETRENSLKLLIKEFRNSIEEEWIENNRTTLLDGLKRCIKKGSNKEQILSPTLFSLTVITMGTDSAPLYKDFSSIFQEMINSEITDGEVLAAMINGLAMGCFVGNEDDQETLNDMDLFKKIFTTKKPALGVAAAIKSWGFLLTTLPVDYAYNNAIRPNFVAIANLLQNSNVEVRVAAGETLAVIIETCKKAQEGFLLKNFSTLMDVESLLVSMQHLGSDRDRQLTKKEADRQKSIFRQVSAYIEDGEEPQEQLSFKQQKFDFHTWSSIIKLECIREVLGEGLHIHFIQNQLIQDIFDISVDQIDRKPKISQLEKKMYLSPNSAASKSQSRERSKQRDSKHNKSFHYDD